MKKALVGLVVIAALGCGGAGSPDTDASGEPAAPAAAPASGGPADAAGGGADGSIAPGGGDGGTASTTGTEDPGSMTSPARLYAADGTSFVVDDTALALDHVLAGASVRHVIVYVHGRSCGGGGEPTKSLGGAVPELESDYHAKALMFSWPGSSSGCPLGFPESEARASGTALAHVLHELAHAMYVGAAKLSGVTLTLVTHSMGNLVLEEALAKDSRPLPPALFATVLLSSSATALSAHAAWLTRLSFSKNVYVSENDGDNVLAAAGTAPGGTRLGKRLATEPLAANAVYVDFTAAGVNHAYYLHSGQKGARMGAFYDAVMAGKPYDFATSKALSSTTPRDGTFVYTFAP